jgi:hypothetical protein
MDHLLTAARTGAVFLIFLFIFPLSFLLSSLQPLTRQLPAQQNLALFLSSLVHLRPASRPHSPREHFFLGIYWPVCFPTAFPDRHAQFTNTTLDGPRHRQVHKPTGPAEQDQAEYGGILVFHLGFPFRRACSAGAEERRRSDHILGKQHEFRIMANVARGTGISLVMRKGEGMGGRLACLRFVFFFPLSLALLLLSVCFFAVHD